MREYKRRNGPSCRMTREENVMNWLRAGKEGGVNILCHAACDVKKAAVGLGIRSFRKKLRCD